MKEHDKINENEERWDEREIEKKKMRRERNETRAKINIFRYFDVNLYRFHIY